MAEDPESDLWKQQPDLVGVILNLNILAPDLVSGFVSANAEQLASAVAGVMEEMNGLISALRKHNQFSTILVHNFAYITDSAYGLYDTQMVNNQNEYIADLNRTLREMCSAETGVYLFDLCGWAARTGMEQLVDNRLFFTTAMTFSAPRLNPLALEYTRYIQAAFTPRRKCLVLDLDNTLWGGVLGEEGMEGIQVGPDYPGNAFLSFQQAILDLYHRGIILAVCSKNDEFVARQVLERHPDMVLHTEHIACMMINWNDKTTNIRKIAEDLSIGLDSLVFLDDSPAERLLIRQQIPEVLVPDLPDNPAEYATFLRRMSDFDTLTLSAEDRDRGRMYQSQVERRQLEQTATSLEDYYVSLDMALEIMHVNASSRSRIVQLTQKTNQFNLTTKRYAESDIDSLIFDPQCMLYSLRVTDRFGDNGITGTAFLFHSGGQCWEIDTFLLSCRILGRTVETAFLAYLIAQIQSQGGRTLQGWFHPTTQNTPAQNFYEKHGFTNIKKENDSSWWTLDLQEEVPSFPAWFRITGETG